MVSLVQLPRVAIYLIMFVCHGEAFVHHSLQRIRHVIATVDGAALYAKSTKPKKKSAASIAGVKGFGGMSTPSSGKDVNMDRSKDALAFYDFLEKNGAGDNLKRAALGYFPLPDGTQLRGVVALRDMKKGDVMIRIPYEIAINLGLEGEDPTMPGLSLLKQYCNAMNGVDEPNGVDHTPYYRMLPEYKGSDCLGSTDFFSDEALEALQAPMVVTETLKRRERTKKGFESIEGPATTWIDGEPMTEQHLRWAVWLITSLPGGELKVVAGAPVQAGEQINICYGGGVAGNDRFLQDYGFLDSDVAFNIVAQQLLGKKRILEGANAGRTISSVDRDVAIERLRMTSMLQDQDLLEKETDPAVKSAILYRLGVKKALSKVIEIE
ncbi:hypothetical protein MHU86_15040 [Fragilaria crotonensis]|nr:hypothetical protein MHU86_15040 [Fragilaria crotonensis]